MVAITLGVMSVAGAEAVNPPRPPATTQASHPAIRSRTIEGQVVDKDGRPISNAKVTAYKAVRRPPRLYGESSWCPFDGELKAIMSWTTGEDGRFNLTGLPGTIPYFIVKAWHRDYLPAKEWLSVRPTQSHYGLRIRMDEGLTVQGTVVAPDGRPIQGAEVTGYGGMETVKKVFTDAEGKFRVRGISPKDSDGGVGVEKDGFVTVGWEKTEQATSSETWRIVLHPRASMEFGGRLKFADGGSAGGVRLEFSLVNKAGERVDTRSAVTEWDGRFRAVLRLPGRYKGMVRGTRNEEDGGTEAFYEEAVDGIEPGRKDLEITFDNRGEMEVVIEPAGWLPAETRFWVFLQYLDHRPDPSPDVLHLSKSGQKAGVVPFRYLQPGRYRVRVCVPSQSNWSWEQQASVTANPDKSKRLVRFALPHIRFGNVRLRALHPDGYKPLSPDYELHVYPSPWGSVKLREDGIAEIQGLPVGSTHLEFRCAPKPSEGDSEVTDEGTPEYEYAKMRELSQRPMATRTVEIRAGQTTDLGDVVLKQEGAESWVEGRVLYDDGEPVVGAVILGQDTGRRNFPRADEAVKSNGRFRWDWYPEQPILRVSPDSTLGWARAVMPLFQDRRCLDIEPLSVARVWRDAFQVHVDVKPGQTLRRDVIVPKSTPDSVRIRFLSAKEGSGDLAVVVAYRDQVFLCHNHIELHENQDILVPHLPSGQKMVVFNGVGDPHYVGFISMDGHSSTGQAVFDLSSHGSIAGKVIQPSGQPVGDVGVVIDPADIGRFGPPERFSWVLGDWMRGFSRFGAWSRTAKDGTFRRDGLSPGRYLIWLAGSDPSTEKVVDVVAGRQTNVDLVGRTAASKPQSQPESQWSTPPLRLD